MPMVVVLSQRDLGPDQLVLYRNSKHLNWLIMISAFDTNMTFMWANKKKKMKRKS